MDQRLRVAVFLALVAFATTVLAVEPEIEPVPEAKTDHDRVLVEDHGPYILSPFERGSSQVRLDVFHESITSDLDRLAEELLQLARRHPDLIVEFHMPMGDGYPEFGQQVHQNTIDMPYFEEVGGSSPDLGGELTEQADLPTLPYARLSYQRYVWKIPLDQAGKATAGLLNRVSPNR